MKVLKLFIPISPTLENDRDT